MRLEKAAKGVIQRTKMTLIARLPMPITTLLSPMTTKVGKVAEKDKFRL